MGRKITIYLLLVVITIIAAAATIIVYTNQDGQSKSDESSTETISIVSENPVI